MVPPSENDENMHLIVHVITEARGLPAYVYIHEDFVSETLVETAASYCWILCRTTLTDPTLFSPMRIIL